MNTIQQKTIDRLRDYIVKRHSNGAPEKHEFKKLEVTDRGALVFLVTEYGRNGDEGTYGELIGRDRRHFVIGRRGGVRLLHLSANLRSTSPTRVRGVFKSVNFWHPAKGDAALIAVAHV